MKKIIIYTLLLTFYSNVVVGQSNKEIASVYFSKTKKAMEKIDYNLAKTNFEKGVNYLGEITNPEIAQTGAYIYFELKKYDKVKEYASLFFSLSSNKETENYKQMLEFYVDVEEKILKIAAEEQKKVSEALKKQIALKKTDSINKIKAGIAKLKRNLELKKIDSLKKVWAVIEKDFILPLDTLHAFNYKGYALYKKAGFYGVIDDKGVVVIAASNYKAALQNEGYFILMDDKISPKKILSFNSEKRKAVELPNPSSFNNNLTNYGIVTLPRGNGRMAMYPNEIRKTIIYDLEKEKFVKISNLKELFKQLKKHDKIDKFDVKEESVKINKIWYSFGGHLGGDVYSLFSTDTNDRYGFLLGSTNRDDDDSVLTVANFDFLGVFFDNKLSAIKDEKLVWITNEGYEGNKPVKLNFYSNEVKIKVLSSGNYQLVKNGVVFLNDKKLEKLRDFIIRNK